MEFGPRIRALRKQQNLTLRELAEEVRIDFTYLSKIETGKGVPPAEETIRRLAKALAAEQEADELVLLADKIPTGLERDLLSRPESQVAGLYRSMAGKSYTEDEWQRVLDLLKEGGQK